MERATKQIRRGWGGGDGGAGGSRHVRIQLRRHRGLLKHANQFHGDAKLSTWLFSITANWCRDYLRKADNKAKEAEDVLITLPAPSELGPDRKLEQREDEKRIQKALTALTPEQREAIL